MYSMTRVYMRKLYFVGGFCNNSVRQMFSSLLAYWVSLLSIYVLFSVCIMCFAYLCRCGL